MTKTYAMADAAGAHRDLEGRATTGSIVLLADYADRRIAPITAWMAAAARIKKKIPSPNPLPQFRLGEIAC